jgi:hypothetical protein
MMFIKLYFIARWMTHEFQWPEISNISRRCELTATRRLLFASHLRVVWYSTPGGNSYLKQAVLTIL